MEICDVCQKQFETKRALTMHKVSVHRWRKHSAEQPQPEQPQPKQPDLLEKLKTFGIDPAEVMGVLSSLVEKSVIATLEKMQLSEAINKRLAEIETRLSSQVASLTMKEAPAQSIADQVPTQNVGDTQLRNIILAQLSQKLIGGDSVGGLDSLLSQQEKIGKLVEAFTKPYRDAEEATLRRVNLMLGIGAKAGLTAKDTMGKIQGTE